MTHLLPYFSASTDALETGLDSADRSAPLDETVILQTILRLAAIPTQPEGAIGQSAVLKPLQTLILAIHRLSATVDRPATPEALLPHVREEVQDVLNALQRAEDSKSAVCAAPASPAFPWPHYFWLQHLAAWLLWGVARSSHRVMRLIEGVPAAAARPDHDWRSGMVRLVALLDIKTPEALCSLDLATYQTSPALLSGDSLVRLNDAILGEQAIADLTEQLLEQIAAATPILYPLIQGVPAEILVPNQVWQSSLVRLRLGVEFISEASAPSGLPAGQFSELNNPLPIVRFTDASWQERYRITMVQQQVAHLLHGCPLLPALDQDVQSLLMAACAIAEQLQDSLTHLSRSLQPEVALDQLAQVLLWSLSHSAYEVMQLMSGIRAMLLQPQHGWVNGTLRFAVHLNVQTPEQGWCLDVITGQPVKPILIAPALDAIVRSEECSLCQQPDLLAHLETKLWQAIHQVTPEIRLLMAGTAIDLCTALPQVEQQTAAPPPHSGVLHLSTAFEFIPDLDFDQAFKPL